MSILYRNDQGKLNMSGVPFIIIQIESTIYSRLGRTVRRQEYIKRVTDILQGTLVEMVALDFRM